MDRENPISQSFSLVLTPLTFMGLYPPEKQTLFFKVRCYLFYVSFLIISAICANVSLVLERNLNLLELTDMCIYVFYATCSCLKVIPFVVNRDRVKKCINFFGQPRFRPRTEEETKIVDECVRICRRNCKIYIFVVVMSLVFWFIPVFCSKEPVLPTKVWLPFDPWSSPQVFCSTFVFFSIATIYDAFAGNFLDPLLGTLSYHATSQLKILKHNLENFGKLMESTNVDKDSVITFRSAYSELNYCIKHYKDILDFIREFENCFSWGIFCQMGGVTLTMSATTISLSLLPSVSVDAFKYGFLYANSVLQQMFYCYYGTLLLEENEGLMDAVCAGPWYRYDPKVRKVFILMMERSKRPLNVTAGKVAALTLATSTWIIKTSYSFYTVMKSLQ